MRFSDFWKASKDERRQEKRDIDAYKAMRLDKETAKFEKQGLSPEDARKYAYRKVYGALQKEQAELKITKVQGNKVTAGDGVEIDLDQVDVDVDQATKKLAIKPKGSVAGQKDPKTMIKPGTTVNLG